MAALVDVESDILDNGRVRVFVIGLHEGEDAVVDAATAALQSYTVFPVEELPLSYNDMENVPFRDTAWVDCGRIRLSIAHLAAPRRSDWEIFQAHRKAFGVLAVGEGSHLSNDAVQTAMTHSIASHGLKDAPVKRCLLFDNDDEDSKEPAQEWLVRLSPAQRGREQMRFVAQQIAAEVVRQVVKVLSDGMAGQPDVVVTPGGKACLERFNSNWNPSWV